MKFAKIVFWIAALWGILVISPLYFLYDTIGRQDKPAITHPGFYYGFAGCALAWQFAFIVIARDPVRFRAMTIPSVFEKFSFTVAQTVLYVFSTDFIRPTCSSAETTAFSEYCSWLRSCGLRAGRRHWIKPNHRGHS